MRERPARRRAGAGAAASARRVRRLQGIRNTPHVIIEKPFRDTVKVADGLAIDVMPEHQKHLGDTLCHADVVVNVASTISIEACIFDTPVVNINFDGPAESPYVTSARRYYSFTHYVNITSRGAVRVAQSPDETGRERRRLPGRSVARCGRPQTGRRSISASSPTGGRPSASFSWCSTSSAPPPRARPHEDLPCRPRAAARSADQGRRHRAVDSRRGDAARGTRTRRACRVPRSRRRPRPARRSTASGITSFECRPRSIGGCRR